MSTPRILLTGGGTGGHITPALATAHAIRRLRPDVEVEFAGTADKLEARMVPADGWPFHVLAARPLRRELTPANLAVPFVVAKAAAQARRLIRERGVVAACVFGGYTSGPLALGARLAGVPLVLHEQNAVPGLANRIAARWADTVAVSVRGVADAFPHPDRVVFTGNPVRGDLAEADLDALRDEAAATFGLQPDRRTLLVFGGSLGAKRLNDAVVGAADRLGPAERIQILHAAGAGDVDRVRAAWERRDADGPPVRCVAFLDRMDLAYALADLVLCRSGASTIAELTACGLPSVLVPYPHAAADEQTANARALTDAGAAELIPDGELDADRLVAVAAPILADDERRRTMGEAASRQGRPDAAEEVARLIIAAARLTPGDAGVGQDGDRR